MKQLPDVKTLRKLDLLIFVIVCLVSVFHLLDLCQHGFESYAGRGDSKFYASCARSFVDTGHMTWKEIYPCHLREGKGTLVTWTAVGQPLFSSLFILVGVSSQKAVVLASIFAYLLMLIAIYWAVYRLTKSRVSGLLGACFLSLVPSVREFAYSGGTESLSQLFLVLQLFSFVFLVEGKFMKSVGLIWSFFFVINISALFCRPQNLMFLLWMAPSFILFEMMIKVDQRFWKKTLLKVTSCILILIVSVICKKIMLAQGDLSFGYMVSFLDLTSRYPSHQIARELFLSGFGVEQLINEKELIIEKMKMAWPFLKMYWPSWLPFCLLHLFLCLHKRYSKWNLICLLTWVSMIFICVLGYKVPRYWTVLQPLTIFTGIVYLLSWNKGWLNKNLVIKAAFVTIFTVTLCYEVQFHKLKKVFSEEPIYSKMPKIVFEQLKNISSVDLVACINPSKVIDQLDRKILLCPQTPNLLLEVNDKISKVTYIIFPPDDREWVKKWKILSKTNELFKKNYDVVHDEDNWVVWRKSKTVN